MTEKTKIDQIADLIKSLTYSEMMEFSGWFSATAAEREWDEERPEDWAEFFDAFADSIIDSRE